MNEGLRPIAPDFLGRLIDKALGHSDAVVPRLPSVFEMLQPVTVQTNPEWDMSVYPHEKVEADVHAQDKISSPVVSKPREDSSRAVSAVGEPDKARFNPLRGAVQRGTIQAEAEVGGEASASASVSLRPATSRGDARSSTQPTVELSLQNRHRVGHEVELPSAVLSAEASPGRVQFVDRKAPIFSTNRTPAPFIGSIHVDKKDGAISKDKTDVARPLDNGFPYTSRTGVMIPHGQLVAAVRSVNFRRADDRQPPPSLVQKAEADAVVNVTIGRIEVRAVTDRSNQVPRKKASQGPKPMGLDEYLRQRGGGR